MMSLSCKDMGQADCDYVAEGETKEEVMMNAAEHAMSVHGKTEADMTPEMKDMAMSMIKES